MALLRTHSEFETITAGRDFSAFLHPGSVVALFGDLGSGKTRFIKGICEGLGIQQHVSSPTFTIVHEYSITGGRVYHFDFYRIRAVQEAEEIGFEEYFGQDNICLIEWAEKVQQLLPQNRFDIFMNLGDDPETREIRIEQTVQEPA